MSARAFARFALFGLSAAVETVRIASAQQPPCDPGLESRADNPYAYRARGDRCEGAYVRQVGGTVLSVASLTSVFETYDLASGKNLTLAWGARADSGLRIRVRGIDRDLYYGMDANAPPGALSYQWPSNILASLKITQPRIGALGWTRRNLGGTWRNIYVPLSITQRGGVTGKSGYELVLFPGVKLQEVYLTFGPAAADGRPGKGKFIKEHEAQRQGYYPAERPIRIRLPPLSPPGLFYLEVSASLPDGRPVAVEPLLVDTSEN